MKATAQPLIGFFSTLGRIFQSSVSHVEKAPNRHPEEGFLYQRTNAIQSDWITVLAISGLGLVFRLFMLSAQNLWIDEAYNFRLLDGSFVDLIKMTISQDDHPPLYYIVLYLLQFLGRSEVAVRLPSVIFGVATIPVVYALACRLFNRQTAIYSGFLLAISPLHIYYSQEARMYALFLLLALGSIVLFLRAIEENRTWDWGAYVVVIILAFYTHVSALFVALALTIHFFAHQRARHTIRRWLVAHAVIFVCCLPWVLMSVLMLSRVEAAAIHHVSLSPFALPYTFFTFCLGYFVGPSIADWHRSLSLAQLVPSLPILVPASVVFGSAFVSGIWRLRRHRLGFSLVLLIITANIFLPYIVANFVEAKYNVRYAVVALPFFLMLVAYGITSVKRHSFRVTWFVVLVALSCYAVQNWYFDDYYAKERVKDAVNYVQMQIQPDDAVGVLGITDSVHYYWPERQLLSPWDPSAPESLSMFNGRNVRPKRFWLIYGRVWKGDPEGRSYKSQLEFLERKFRVDHAKSFPGVTVTLYTSLQSTSLP